MQKYICYTDGSYKASKGESGQGGWASIILDSNDNVIKRLFQGYTNTSNNRMELRAVLETLNYFNEPSDITIITDSQYVANGITDGNAENWIKNNDLTKKNLDLWFQIVNLLYKHKVTVKWVKGHAGNKWNEEADKWCTFAAECLNLPKDVWTM